MQLVENREKRILVRNVIVVGFISMILALTIAFVITGHLWELANIEYHIINMRVGIALNRANVLFPIFFFLGAHFVFPIKMMYNWMFDKRWVLGIALLLFMTVNQYHGNSISFYDEVIQPNETTESSKPFYVGTRYIRSDEFLVSFPSTLASTYGEDAYSQYNEIMRGTKTLSVMSGVYLGFSTIGNAPQKFVYAILPVEYAYSFCWWFPLIMGFLMCIELFYIMTNKMKLLSTVGATLIIFSAFYLWWGFSIYYMAAPGTVVCVHYFLQTDKRWKKILYGLGTAICFSMFVTNLYPAWQVPLGYMFLAIGIWVIHLNWNNIKHMKIADWTILGASVFFMATLIISHLYTISEYSEIISQTVYPGERADNGSFYMSKLFYCAQVPFYAYKEIGNASEMGAFFSLFPVPTIVAAYCWIKEKKKDWLIGGLLLAQIPMLIYLTVGFPEVVAKILLFNNSTVSRTCDIVGLMQMFFMVIILSRYADIKKFSLKVAIPIGVVVALLNIYTSSTDFPDYLCLLQKVVMGILIALLSIGLMVNLKEKKKQLLCFTLIAVSFFTSIYIRPLLKGFDAVLEKPVAKEIQEICVNNPDAKWLTVGGGHVLSAFNVACGASTVNSVNTYPNLELWEKFDTDSQYDDIYNRYAHVNVELANEETSFELIQDDYMQLTLSYEDIQLTEAEYLLVMGEPNIDMNNIYVEFQQVYSEDGMSIYHMIY